MMMRMGQIKEEMGVWSEKRMVREEVRRDLDLG
jgi:hypothetical protein